MADVIIWTSLSSTPGIIRSVGPYAIKSWLMQHGYSVKVVDFCAKLTVEEIVQITERFLSDSTIAIGMSTTFLDIGCSRKLLQAREIIESKNKKVKWVAGGYHAGINRYDALKNWIQFSGLAEDKFLTWLDEQRNTLVKRILFDITTCRHQWDDSDIVLPGEALPIELGRGCKFKCKFCQYPLIGKQTGTYIRNLDYVKEEMISNYERWGVTNYYFIDDTVNEDDWKMQKIYEIAQHLPFQLQWVGYQRADLIYSHPHQQQWIKDSGCLGTFFGIESLHREASKTVGKGWSAVHAREFIPELFHNIWKNQIGVQLSFIAGLPGEDGQSLENTQQWCIDSEFDEWRFVPLFISLSPLVWQSEFDKNFKKYGYEFKDPSNKLNWSNDIWSFKEAENYANELNKTASRHISPGCWQRNSLYKSIGRDFKREKFSTIDKDDTDARVNQRIKEYVKRSLEYPVY
jgi:radical SAM superfamily enzyme YgiQ (UPF0313 family)